MQFREIRSYGLLGSNCQHYVKEPMGRASRVVAWACRSVGF